MGTDHQRDWGLYRRTVLMWTSKKHNVDWIHLAQILYNSRSSEHGNKLAGLIKNRKLLEAGCISEYTAVLPDVSYMSCRYHFS